MSKHEKRLNDIISILKEKNGASIKELAVALNVSEMTIRRDLNILKLQNAITLIHGAAIYNSENKLKDKNYDLFKEKDKCASEKYNIGKKAISLLKPNDVIIIDTGTTTEYIARLIPDDLPLTIICYTTNVLVEIYKKPLIKIIFAGGFYHRNSQMFQSPEAIELIKRTCANKVFISASGVNKELGVTCVNHYEIETKNTAIKSSIEKILMVDSTKFDKIGPAYFSDITEFDTIITDSHISKKWIDYIKELNIQLHIV